LDILLDIHAHDFLKMEILVKNLNFSQKSKFWSEIEILSKIEILEKNPGFSQNRNFGQKSKIQFLFY